LRTTDTSKIDRADTGNDESDYGDAEHLAPGKAGNGTAEEDEHSQMQHRKRDSFTAPEIVTNGH
jgi:hypothetical protein